MSSVVLRSIASTHSTHDFLAGTDPMVQADADFRHVIDIWTGLAPRPLDQCATAAEARAQPTVAMALGQLLRGRADAGGVSLELRMIPGGTGSINARVYAPAGRAAARPLLLYLHGGGWVTGDPGRFDALPRVLARKLDAVVVAPHYAQAPEHPRTAAAADARAAFGWMLAQAAALGGDSMRVSIVGEDAGADLAVDVAVSARNDGARVRHLGLIGPMGQGDFELPSYARNADGLPLGTAGARWLHKQAGNAGTGWLPVEMRNLGGLPPATVILGGLDPLQSEGEALAAALRRSGVWVDATTYDGVGHGFIGLSRVVNKAMFAEAQLVRNLRESLGPAGS